MSGRRKRREMGGSAPLTGLAFIAFKRSFFFAESVSSVSHEEAKSSGCSMA